MVLISGTTGPPKGVMLTHSNVCANTTQVGHPGTMKIAYCPATSSNEISNSFANIPVQISVEFWLTDDSSDSQEVIICVLPFFHMYGILPVMLSGLDHGAKLVTLPRFESSSYLNSVHQHRVSVELKSWIDFLVIQFKFCKAIDATSCTSTSFVPRTSPWFKTGSLSSIAYGRCWRRSIRTSCSH